MASHHIQIMVSINDRTAAKALIKALLAAHLIACGQCIPGVVSYYRWQGEVCADDEFLLLLKTQKQHYDAVEQLILKHHPYDTPEIIAVDIVAGSDAYLTWITDETCD